MIISCSVESFEHSICPASKYGKAYLSTKQDKVYLSSFYQKKSFKTSGPCQHAFKRSLVRVTTGFFNNNIQITKQNKQTNKQKDYPTV